MTEQDDQLLSQFLDGELAKDDARAVRERLLAEPSLRARFNRMQAVTERVKSAFAAPEADAVPARVKHLLDAPDTDRAHLTAVRRAGWGLAVAASVLAVSGLLLQPGINQQSPEPDAHIAAVLEKSPSRAEGWDTLPGGERLRPVLSFQSTSGQWCREYLLQRQDSGWRGVACRDDRGWRTRVITEAAAPGLATDYRPAAAADSGSIATFIDNNAADIPLDAREEARLIADQWQ
jgi:hypothetical protein